MYCFIKFVGLMIAIQIVTCKDSTKLFVLSNVDDYGQPIFRRDDSENIDGIFVNFLRNFLHLLSTGVPGKRLVRLCRLWGYELDRFDYKHTIKLAKHVRRLSRKHRDNLVDEMVSYRQELDQVTPLQRDFLQAMNKVFTLQHAVLFQDFISDLRDYSARDKIDLDKETRSLLNMIVEAVKQLSTKDQNTLEEKLKKAVKEYKYKDITSWFNSKLQDMDSKSF